MLVAVSKQPVKASDTCGDREREALSAEYLALHLIPPQLNSYQTLFLFFSAFVYCFVFSKFPTKRRKYELSARGQILHFHLLTRSRVTPCQLFFFFLFWFGEINKYQPLMGGGSEGTCTVITPPASARTWS